MFTSPEMTLNTRAPSSSWFVFVWFMLGTPVWVLMVDVTMAVVGPP